MTPMAANSSFRDPGEPPVIDWIDKTLIDIDPAYQRGLDEARVQRILDWFEWRSFGAVVIARTADGRYHCIDGQHRLAAAQRHPSVENVPAVIIVTPQTVQAEAEVFVTVNRDRKNVTALELYWAQLAAGDGEAVTVAQVVERAGITIARYPMLKYGTSETIAISAIRSVIDNKGAMRARQILDVLAKAGLSPVTGMQVRAAELLLTDAEFKDEIEPDALADSLGGNGEQIAAEAKAFAKTHRAPAARAFASVWFRKTRKRRKAA